MKINWFLLIVFLAVMVTGLSYLGKGLSGTWATLLGWVFTIGGVLGIVYLFMKKKTL